MNCPQCNSSMSYIGKLEKFNDYEYTWACDLCNFFLELAQDDHDEIMEVNNEKRKLSKL